MQALKMILLRLWGHDTLVAEVFSLWEAPKLRERENLWDQGRVMMILWNNLSVSEESIHKAWFFSTFDN